MGITFDFFNTLIEPKNKYVMRRSYKAIYEIGVKHGLTISFDEFLNKAVTNWQEVLRKRMEEGRETAYTAHLLKLFKDAGLPLPEDSIVVKESISSYFEILATGVQPVEGVYEVLERLSKKYKIGLITNFTYPPFVRAQLDAHNLSEFFEVVTISGDYGFSKPFPKIFIHTLHRMNLKPNKTVHIGDSFECDVIGAKKAGLRAVWVKRNDVQKRDCEQQSDLIIYRLTDLLRVNLDELICGQKENDM